MKRAIIRIQFDLEAKRALDDLCERRGMTQIAVTSRLMKWFVLQDEAIQTAVLGGLSEPSMATLAKHILEKIAKDGKA